MEEPVEEIKSSPVRPQFGKSAQMPLADAGGGVSFLLEDLRNGLLFQVEADLFSGEEHIRNPGPERVPSAEDGCPGGAAERCGRVIIRELLSLSGHLVNARCGYLFRAVAPEVLVAQVIRENHHYIRQSIGIRILTGEKW